LSPPYLQFTIPPLLFFGGQWSPVFGKEANFLALPPLGNGSFSFSPHTCVLIPFSSPPPLPWFPTISPRGGYSSLSSVRFWPPFFFFPQAKCWSVRFPPFIVFGSSPDRIFKCLPHTLFPPHIRILVHTPGLDTHFPQFETLIDLAEFSFNPGTSSPPPRFSSRFFLHPRLLTLRKPRWWPLTSGPRQCFFFFPFLFGFVFLWRLTFFFFCFEHTVLFQI